MLFLCGSSCGLHRKILSLPLSFRHSCHKKALPAREGGQRRFHNANWKAMLRSRIISRIWHQLIQNRMSPESHNQRQIPNCFFRRSHQKQAMDCVEELNGVLRGYEIKWREARLKRIGALSPIVGKTCPHCGPRLSLIIGVGGRDRRGRGHAGG